MPTPNQRPENLGTALGTAALRTLLIICPEVREGAEHRQEAACRAMRETSRDALFRLLDDAREAPWMSELAFADAALTIAKAGADAFRKTA